MPIVMNNDGTITSPNTPGNLVLGVETPQYFSDALTGSGGKVGFFNNNLKVLKVVSSTLNPLEIDKPINKKRKYIANDMTTRFIPLSTLNEKSFLEQTTVPVPPMNTMLNIPTVDGSDSPVYLHCEPQAIAVREERYTDQGTVRTHLVRWQVTLFNIKEPQQLRADVNFNSSPGNVAITAITDNLNIILNEIPNKVLADWGINVYTTADSVLDYFDAFSLYHSVKKLANDWAGTGVADRIVDYINAINTNNHRDSLMRSALLDQMRYLENYKVNLQAYVAIYTALRNKLPLDEVKEIAKQNLNLLMADTLQAIERCKTQVAPIVEDPHSTWNLEPFYSAEQRAAIQSREPYVMVQSGAGTGKSTVILSRIDYLTKKCNVPEADITVLSFTNAAADNILEKNPAVGSMTIARMIHDIYLTNYPGHELSEIDTLINSLHIFYPLDDVAMQLTKLLRLVALNERGSFTILNNFIEDNFDEVIRLLNGVKQTTLELEIIVCYQKINTMAEPPNIMSKHLIIDEVQDNSVFEFIFVVKYVAKHVENLYIVGDASQTLYEFRSSDPKALNMLESSGIFTTYSLKTNYRSTGEILTFANRTLADIAANSFAGIQLRPNNFQHFTATDFKKAVTLDYQEYRKLGDFSLALKGKLSSGDVADYVDQKLAAGEQVAFLAYSRREVGIAEQAFTERWPQAKIANLVPMKGVSNTVFSTFVKKYWDSIKQIPVENAAFAIQQNLLNNLHQIVSNVQKAESIVRETINKWWTDNSNLINSWVNLVKINKLSRDQFFTDLRDNLLQWEIRNNAIRKSLLMRQNKQRKEENAAQDADIVISTIHSAKGLEFDNVILTYKADSRMSEENKRMYYVALTRAKKSEYILGYGTIKNAAIVNDYHSIVDALNTATSSQDIVTV